MPLYHLRRYLGSSLWLIPLLCVLASVALSLGTTAIDRHFDYGLIPQVFTGNPAAAQSILSTIATSMITLLSIVLTVTLVAVQLAMGQFSPRIVRALLQDRRSQFAVGLFAATFAYSILALREVDPQGSVLPGLAVVTAYILVLTSIVVVILYVHHSSQRLRVAGLVDLVGGELRKQVDYSYPPEQAERAPSRQEDSRVII